MIAFNKETLISREQALPDRHKPMAGLQAHHVLGRSLTPPFPSGLEQILLGLGCFWGAERLFWQASGVWTTAVGYAGGFTAHPSYQDVCSGQTGHTEVVLVVFDPTQLAFRRLLQLFWEAHDPTQGLRQGNDRGSQYRSAIYTTTLEQARTAAESLQAYQHALDKAGRSRITTELRAAGPLYYAEDHHQQYLAKNPGGYCGLKGTGVPCPH